MSKRHEIDFRGWGEEEEDQEEVAVERRSPEEIEESIRLKAEKAKRFGYVAVLVLFASLVWLLVSGWGALLSSRAPNTETLPIAFFVIAAAVGIWLVSRPISIAAGYDNEWLLFQTYIWLLPIFVLSWLPLVGGPLVILLGLLSGFRLWRGRLGSSRINSGGVSGVTSSYDAVVLKAGEGRPAALYFLGLALLARPAFLPLLLPDEAVVFLRLLGVG